VLSFLKEEIAVLSLRTILHPNDLSEHCENALQLAATIARDHGSRLILLYVKPDQETVIGEFGSPPPEKEPTDEEYRQQLRQRVESETKLNAECLVGEGRPVDVILQVAQKEKCDLIVLGSHAHSWLGRLFTSDVVEQVLHKARCTVVTVRDPS
jgi:nucleotide-binding universal stress UspA family protein